jgi:hypothetical protein
MVDDKYLYRILRVVVSDLVSLPLRATVSVGATLTRSHIPSRRKNEQISQRSSEISRFGGQNTEYGWINVIDRYRTNIDELGQVILVWNLMWQQRISQAVQNIHS